MREPISNPDHGLRLTFAPEPSAPLHQFCGTNTIKDASCPYCQKPLLRVLSLSANDPQLNLDPSKTPIVHLLYCWTCSIPYGVFSYRILRDGSLQLLEVPPIYKEAFGPDGPYEGYTGQFPLRLVALTPLTQSEHQSQLQAWSDEELSMDHGRKNTRSEDCRS